MPISTDWSIYDSTLVYTLLGATKAWARVTKISDESSHLVDLKLNELIAGCESGALPYKSSIRGATGIQDHFGGFKAIGRYTHWPKCEVEQNDLKAFFDKRGEKPPFLFPESRDDLEAERTNPKLTENNASIREEVLEAALAILAKYPDECRSKDGKVMAAKIGKLIEQKAPEIWPSKGQPPRESGTIDKLICKAISRLKE